MKNENTTEQRSLRPAAFIAVAALSALLGFAAVYGTLTSDDNTSESASVTPPATKAPVDGGSKGSLAAFVKKKVPEELAPVSFVDADGKNRTLADFKGKVVLLNLWATWCGPCREEMPSLDRLQKEMGSDAFEVVALAVDRTGVDSVKKFLAEIKVETLGLYVDATAKSGSQLKAVGLPTTILIGKDGREIGRLPGSAHWDSAEAKDMIKSALQ